MSDFATPTAAGALATTLVTLRDRANQELGRRETGQMFVLMRDMMLRLPDCDLLAADKREIQKAGRAMLADGHSKEEMQFLQRGLTALYDLACTQGLTSYNPIRGTGSAENVRRTGALIVGVPKELVDRVKGLSVSSAGGEIEIEPSPAGAVELVRWYPFRFVVSWYPLPAPGIEKLLTHVRDKRSPTRTVGLVLVCPRDKEMDAGQFVGLGANHVLLEDDISDLGELLRCLERGEIRVDLKVPLKVTSTGLGDTSVAMWQTENLSASGMLIRTRAQIPVGTPFGLEFSIPGDPRPVKGHAEIVRASHSIAESVEGLGAHFVDLEGDGKARLSLFLSSRRFS